MSTKRLSYGILAVSVAAFVCYLLVVTVVSEAFELPVRLAVLEFILLLVVSALAGAAVMIRSSKDPVEN